MAEKLELMSMDPDDFIRGGLLSDVDVEVIGAVFKIWDYDPNDAGGGTGGLKTLALKLTLKDMASGEEMAQFWSAGDPASFAIVDADGNIGEAEGVGITSTTKKGVNDSTNIYHLFNSLKTNGFPRDRLVNFRCESIIGLQGHVVRNAAPKRQGLNSQAAQEGREKTILVFSKIIKLPWETAAKKGATKKAAPPRKTSAAAAPAPANSTAPDSANDELTVFGVEVVNALLAVEGVIAHKTLRVEALKHMATQKVAAVPQRNPIASMVADEEWLLVNGFMVVDGNVMAAE